MQLLFRCIRNLRCLNQILVTVLGPVRKIFTPFEKSLITAKISKSFNCLFGGAATRSDSGRNWLLELHMSRLTSKSETPTEPRVTLRNQN
jgi:hypothetical protein